MKILLVDDNESVRDSFASALEDRGHRVYRAATYQDAIDVIAEHNDLIHDPFVAAIVDYDLGLLSDRDGPETVRALKTLDPTMGICLWSGITRDPVEGADIQLRKGSGAIDELLDWLKYEEEIHSS